MFKKLIVGVVAGLVLAAGVVSAEAAQASHQSSSGASDSAFAAKRCARYPASVFTHTSLSIAKLRQHRGQSNSATVRVSSNAGSPRGSVTVTGVQGHGFGYAVSASVSHGVAHVALPSRLHRGTYSVHASFRPVHCSKYKRSSSATKTYRVVR